jgi:hypothetical protein
MKHAAVSVSAAAAAYHCAELITRHQCKQDQLKACLAVEAVGACCQLVSCSSAAENTAKMPKKDSIANVKGYAMHMQASLLCSMHPAVSEQLVHVK